MIKISAAIITFNEEKNIRRCIESLDGLADEVVVVDSFSTDNTERICHEYKIRFLQNPFEGHIQQKNFAVSQCQHSIVLSLDADEAVSPELRQSILEVKHNWQADGYTFNRLTNYCGKWIMHCGWYPDRKLRLWDKSKGKWGGVNPHDMVLLNPEARIIHLNGNLLHYSYYNIRQHIQQVNSFTSILAGELFKKGKRAPLTVVLFKPVWKFFRDYLFKGGIIDGYEGFLICSISAFATFIKYVKLRELYRRN